MKRAAYDGDGDDYGGGSGDHTLTSTGSGILDGRTLEKRARSGSPPMIVGPLVFNGRGTELQQALFEVEPSNLPGVHRLSTPTSSLVRLWSPQWPTDQYLETDLSNVLQAINGKCVFIFDTRPHPDSEMLSNVIPLDWLLNHPTIQRSGMFVGKYAPNMNLLGGRVAHLPIPYVQDPVSSLAILCHFYEYLGPSAVCVKNGEVVATTMLSRSPETLYTTLEEWNSI